MHHPTERREEEEERLPLSIDDDDDLRHSSSSSDDEDFEFAFVSDPDAAVSAADDIFADGKILPIYPRPFFSSSNNNNKVSSKQLRNLFLESVEEKNDSSKSFSSSSSAAADELEGVPEGTYCVWTPKSSESALKKSGSIGTSTSSSSLRVKIRDLVIGRSRSDGKEKLLYFPAAASGGSDGGYKKVGGGRGGGGDRKTFLPYRQEIVGIFGSGKATGRAHTHRPF